MREGYSQFSDDSRNSLFVEDGRPSWSSSASSGPSAFSLSASTGRCRAACNRSNPLFLPIVGVSLLAFVLFVLAVTEYARSPSSSSASPSAFPSSYPLASLIGPPLVPPTSAPSLSLTFLQLNDVYELLPLGNGTRGGLARVAYIRSLLLQENPATLTVLAGDLLSPSPIGGAVVNGSELQGRQMVDVMNALGLDYAVFGNHEMDLSNSSLLARIAESRFAWLSLNTLRADQPTVLFPGPAAAPSNPNPGYVLRTVNGIRLLLIALQIDSTVGSPRYVTILPPATAIALARQRLRGLAGQFDVAVALTHWDLDTDIALVEAVPELALVMGGHEHANYYLARGTQYTPVAKADSNDGSLYVHRLSFVPSTGAVYSQSHLQIVDAAVPSDPVILARAQYWQSAGLAAFEAVGFSPSATVCNLGTAVWDGRSEIVRSDPSNPLTQAICRSLLYQTPSAPTIALYNTGSARVDDLLEGELTQYDALRILPFANKEASVTITGAALLTVLNDPSNVRGNGMFLSTCGELKANGSRWLVNGVDLATTPQQRFVVATSDYLAGLRGIGPGVLGELMSLQFIRYLTASQCGTSF